MTKNVLVIDLKRDLKGRSPKSFCFVVLRHSHLEAQFAEEAPQVRHFPM